MVQLSRPVDPFGEVNVYKQPEGTIQVVATVLMEPDIEGARCGLALDGSASMKKMYGATKPVSALFTAQVQNWVEPVARTMAAYLARFSSRGTVNMIHWACAPDGSQVEEIGEFTAEQVQSLEITGPRKLPWGRGTKLLPPVRYFVEKAFRDAPWAICVFVTDGWIEDIAAVKEYCFQFARQVASGQRAFIKFVLLGVGEEVDEAQMTELDDMFEGSGLKDPRGEDIDLWDHKLATEMRQLAEIFAEVVSEEIIITDHGQILDTSGRVVKHYADGLPALLRFDLPVGSTAFTLTFPGGQVTQDLTEGLARL